MDLLISKIDGLQTREDFVAFIELLLNDLKQNAGRWENNNLESYLAAVASWTEDMDGFYINNNIQIPQNVDWKVFANILFAATMYE